MKFELRLDGFKSAKHVKRVLISLYWNVRADFSCIRYHTILRSAV